MLAFYMVQPLDALSLMPSCIMSPLVAWSRAKPMPASTAALYDLTMLQRG